MSDRRKIYRVPPGEGFFVTVDEPSRGEHRGAVLDLTSAGIGVNFEAPDLPCLPIGSVVDLVLNAPGLEDPISLRSAVRVRTDTPGNRRYGLQFTKPEELERILSGDMRRLFNRRNSFRAEPRPEDDVKVELRPGEEHEGLPARLEDVSATGVGVVVNPGTEHVLAAASEVEVVLSLPGQSPLVFGAAIRNRRGSKQGVRYGIEFDGERTQGFSAKQDTVVRYVMSCQQRDLAQRCARQKPA